LLGDAAHGWTSGRGGVSTLAMVAAYGPAVKCLAQDCFFSFARRTIDRGHFGVRRFIAAFVFRRSKKAAMNVRRSSPRKKAAMNRRTPRPEKGPLPCKSPNAPCSPRSCSRLPQGERLFQGVSAPQSDV